MAATRYRLLDLLIDIPRQRVERDGTVLDVGGLSFQLLAYLLGQGDRVVSFDELIAAIWAPAVVNEETVTQRIKLLRQALGDDGRRPRYVRSVRGRGYQLCASPEAGANDTVPSGTGGRHIRPRTGAAAVVVGVVVVIAGASLALLHRATPVKTAPTAQQELIGRAAYYAGIGQGDNNERAIALYEQALAAAPRDVDAQLGLSRAYSARVCLYNAPGEWTGRARELAGKALASDPHNAKAWAALGYAQDCAGRIDDAIDGYEHAFALDPADDASRSSAAYLYQEKGHLADALRTNLDMHGDPARVRFRGVQVARELELLGFTAVAEAHFRRIFQLNPDNIFSNIAWPRFLFLQGRFAEAQSALDESVARKTERADLYLLDGELALLRGDRNDAGQAFDQASRLRPQASLPATLAALYAKQPPTPEWLAQRIADVSAGDNAAQVWPVDQLELVYLELAAGNRTQALAVLNKAIAAGYSDKAYLQTSPLFHALAGDPGFASAIDMISRRVAAERQRVLAADWCPAEIRATP
jgi:DNA-binding winged helix-turn-helix (wHTH) protein/tetratricopeptide (TPR) repeat protein